MTISPVQRLRERADTLITRLRLIERQDRSFTRRSRGWTVAATVVAAVGVMATVIANEGRQAPPTVVFFLFAVPAVFVCAAPAWYYHRLDLDDRKITLALRLVTILRADIAAKHSLDVTVDLRGYRRGAQIVDRSGWALGNSVKKYRHAWLTLRARLADGNLVVVSVVDRITQRQKRKTHGGKTKYKTRVRGRSDVRIAVRLARRYRPGTDVARRLRAAPAVPGLTLASVTSALDGVRLDAVFRSPVVLDAAALPGPEPVLGVLRWLYTGLVSGAAVRRA